MYTIVQKAKSQTNYFFHLVEEKFLYKKKSFNNSRPRLTRRYWSSKIICAKYWI